MKTKLFLTLLLLAALGGSLSAQLNPAPSSTGNITTNAANCNTTNACIVLHMASSNVGYSVTVSGTWTGTLTVEQSGDNQGSWTSATTTTANTLFTSALLPGITDARVRGSAAMTGTAVITITASGPAIIQNITQTGSSSNSSVGPAIYATASKYNLPASGYFSCVANYSNASTTLTTNAATDVPFTSAMVGWQIFMTNGVCQGQNGGTTGVVAFQGTIAAVNGPNNITLSGTPSISCAGSQSTPLSCRAYWVPSDSAAALNAAWADATAFRGSCYTLLLPVGVYKFNAPIISSALCGTNQGSITGTAYNGPSVKGVNMSSTILVADPSFNAATCNPGCLFSISNQQSLWISDMTITGGGNATVTNGAGKFKVASTNWPSTIQNVLLDYWGYSGANNFSGLSWSGVAGGQSYISNVQSYNGGFNCAQLGGGLTVNQLFCFTPAGSTITATQGPIYTYGSNFENTAGITMNVISQSVWHSYGDILVEIGGNNGAVQSNGTIYCEGSSFTGNSGATVQLNSSGQPGVMYANGCSFSNNGGASIISAGVAGSKFFDLGGNTIANPNTWTNIQLVADGHSVKGICTGVGTAASTLGLRISGSSVTGTGIPTTCTSTTLDAGIPIQGARTVSSLIVTSTAAGTNASSGVVTVLKNGGATTITCTIGTATTCFDGTHSVAFADGDLISIQFTTQAADTLAGVKAIVEWN